MRYLVCDTNQYKPIPIPRVCVRYESPLSDPVRKVIGAKKSQQFTLFANTTPYHRRLVKALTLNIRSSFVSFEAVDCGDLPFAVLVLVPGTKETFRVNPC